MDYRDDPAHGFELPSPFVKTVCVSTSIVINYYYYRLNSKHRGDILCLVAVRTKNHEQNKSMSRHLPKSAGYQNIFFLKWFSSASVGRISKPFIFSFTLRTMLADNMDLFYILLITFHMLHSFLVPSYTAALRWTMTEPQVLAWGPGGGLWLPGSRRKVRGLFLSSFLGSHNFYITYCNMCSI